MQPRKFTKRNWRVMICLLTIMMGHWLESIYSLEYYNTNWMIGKTSQEIQLRYGKYDWVGLGTGYSRVHWLGTDTVRLSFKDGECVKAELTYT